MSALAVRLNQAFLAPLDGSVASHGALDDKPMLLDLQPPLGLKLRLYVYSLVGGAGERKRGEYKVVLRTRGQPLGEYSHFDHSDGRFTVVAGYASDLDIFVLWDASLHSRFKNGGNLQVKDEVVRAAAAVGHAEQIRVLTTGDREVVLVCQSWMLPKALEARVLSTGGLREGEWVTFLN